MQNNKNQPSPNPQPQKPYSNLIFNQQKRAVCALSFPASPTKLKHCSREHSIMLLRKSKKEGTGYGRDWGDGRDHRSVEIIANSYGSNKINVINLMSCSMSTNQKLRSNYCKKITLTNVDKYYEFCLKKMRAISSPQPRTDQKKEERPQSSTRKSRPQTPYKKPLNNDQTPSTTTPPNAAQISNLVISKQLQNPTLKNQQTHCLNQYKLLKNNIANLSQSQSHNPSHHNLHHHLHDHSPSPRDIHSSFNHRQTTNPNRRYLSTNQQYRNGKNGGTRGKNNQFAIDAWESSDNLDQYIF